MSDQMPVREELFDEPEDVGNYYFLRDLVQVRKQSGRKATSVLYDFMRLSWRSKRVIDPEFYFKYRLFDVAGMDDDAMYGFMDAKSYLKANQLINFNRAKHSAIDNKGHLEAILRSADIPVVETLAVFSTLASSPTIGISTIDEAINFFRNSSRYPLFGKPNLSSRSVGVSSIKAFNESTGTLTLEGKGDVAVDIFCEEVFEKFGDYGYVVQSRLRPHQEMVPICGDAIGCVRLVTILEEKGPSPLYAVWKIPAKGEIADNFWRDGNRVAGLNIENGRVERMQIGSGVFREVELVDPITGVDLDGYQIPFWEDVIRLGCQTALLFQHAPIIGWDIAITEEGPVIVEANSNPDHGLYQLAHGIGFGGSDEGVRVKRISCESRDQIKALNRETKLKNREIKNTVAKKALSQGFKVSDTGEK